MALIAKPPTYTRTAVRYVRDDISVYLVFRSFLFQKTVVVKLTDITSKGAAILTVERLSVHQKVRLILHFKTGKEFSIPAQIVRHRTLALAKNEYGIRFDCQHHALGDYFIATQTQLVFK